MSFGIKMLRFPKVDCISIPMSYVAGLIGKNPWKHVGEETEQVFKRYNSKVLNNVPIEKNEQELINDLENNHNDFYQKYVHAIKIKKLEREANVLMQKLCKKYKKSYKNHRLLLLKRRGFYLESAAREAYCRKFETTCAQVNRAFLYISEDMKIHHSPIPNAVMRLVGKADGITPDNSIIELKCRRSGFKTLFFETLQLSIYVIAYKAKSGRLVEFFEGNIMTRTISKEDAYENWKKIKENFYDWLCFARNCMF